MSIDRRPFDSGAAPGSSDSPEFDAVVRLLALRRDRLAVRPGLCDRVHAAVERELDAPMILASIAPARWRRSLAIAAGVLLACGVTATLVLRGDAQDGTAPRAAVAPVVADASQGERMLIALIQPSPDVATRDRASVLEEIIPGSHVRLDELDDEMRALIGDGASPARDATP